MSKASTVNQKEQQRDAVATVALEFLKDHAGVPADIFGVIDQVKMRLRKAKWSAEDIDSLWLRDSGNVTAGEYRNAILAQKRNQAPSKAALSAVALMQGRISDDLKARIVDAVGRDPEADAVEAYLRKAMALGTLRMSIQDLQRESVEPVLIRRFFKAILGDNGNSAVDAKDRLNYRFSDQEMARLLSMYQIRNPSARPEADVAYDITINGIRIASTKNGQCRLSLPDGRKGVLDARVSFTGRSASLYSSKEPGGTALLTISSAGIDWSGIGEGAISWSGEGITPPGAAESRSVTMLGNDARMLCAELGVDNIAALGKLYEADFNCVMATTKPERKSPQAEVLVAMKNHGVSFRPNPTMSLDDPECLRAMGKVVYDVLRKEGIAKISDLGALSADKAGYIIRKAVWATPVQTTYRDNVSEQLAEAHKLARTACPAPEMTAPNHDEASGTQGVRWDMVSLSSSERAILDAFAEALSHDNVSHIHLSRWNKELRATLSGEDCHRYRIWESTLCGDTIPGVMAGIAFRWLPMMVAVSPIRAVMKSGVSGDITGILGNGFIHFRADGKEEGGVVTLDDVDVIAPGQKALEALCSALGVKCPPAPETHNQPPQHINTDNPVEPQRVAPVPSQVHQIAMLPKVEKSPEDQEDVAEREMPAWYRDSKNLYFAGDGASLTKDQRRLLCGGSGAQSRSVSGGWGRKRTVDEYLEDADTLGRDELADELGIGPRETERILGEDGLEGGIGPAPWR